MTADRMRWREIHELFEEDDRPALIAALSHPDVTSRPRRRCLLIQRLARLNDPRVIPELSHLLLTDEFGEVRQAAAHWLGQLGDPAAIPALREAVRDPHETTSCWAIRSLGEVGDRESLDMLTGILHTGTKDMRWCAAAALGDLGDQRATPNLITALRDPSWKVQRPAAQALVKLRDSRALAPLRELREEVAFWRLGLVSRLIRNLEASL